MIGDQIDHTDTCALNHGTPAAYLRVGDDFVNVVNCLCHENAFLLLILLLSPPFLDSSESFLSTDFLERIEAIFSHKSIVFSNCY